jgi:murein DD-endopeptidase MepM/ murein hydrolase activator NlpD
VSGESAPISILISSKSVTDLASRKALLERIAEKDRGLFNDVRVIRDAVLAKKKEQDRVVVTIAELGERQKAEMAELANVRSEKKKIFSVLKAQEDALEDQLEEMLRESSRLEAQIAEIQARTSGSVAIFRGRFIQPVSGRMSSGFGMRTHPISGRRKMHTGVDWAAPTGTQSAPQEQGESSRRRIFEATATRLLSTMAEESRPCTVTARVCMPASDKT